MSLGHNDFKHLKTLKKTGIFANLKLKANCSYLKNENQIGRY